MSKNTTVFDRFESAFYILKNNFFDLFFTIYVYQFLVFIIYWVFLTYLMLTTVTKIISKWLWTSSQDFFNMLNLPEVSIFIIIFMIVIISVSILYIPFFIWLIYSIKQATYWITITPKENLFKWFKKIINSFNTYWYMFVYVALIPAIFFIIWWILFNAWYFNWQNSNLIQTWTFLMIFWWMLFVIFALYRWIKTSFSIISAVDNDSFTKEDFKKSVYITNNNYLRIIWNILIVSFLVSTVSSILNTFTSFLSYDNSFDFSSIKDFKVEDIKNILSNYSIFWEILKWFFSSIITTIWSIFTTIFMYLFYLRLREESNYYWDTINKIDNNNDNTIEL